MSVRLRLDALSFGSSGVKDVGHAVDTLSDFCTDSHCLLPPDLILPSHYLLHADTCW